MAQKQGKVKENGKMGQFGQFGLTLSLSSGKILRI
jgi:hypothetical protein